MSFDSRTILLVEDNEDDVFIFTRAFKRTQLPHPVHVVRDGEKAIAYLRGDGEFADRVKHPLPFLVLLDLKLPFTPGLEVLRAIRARAAIADVCVIMLTSSAESRDILRAHELGAQAFLVKPPTSESLAAAVAAALARMKTADETIPKIPGDRFEKDFPAERREVSSRG